MTSTSKPRRSAAAPRLAGLVGAFVLHAGLYAAAAATFVAVGAVDGTPGRGTPLAVSWAPTPAASDDVVALPPTVDDARTPPPQVRPPVEDIAVVDAPIDAPPSKSDERATSDCESAAPRPPHAYAAMLPPRRGGGGTGDGVASTAIGVGGPGGSGGSVGAGGGWSGAGAGSTAGDGDGGGDGSGRAGRGGATRGPSIVGTLAAPTYPSKARSRGWEGRVVLLLSIDEHGRVVAVEVAESSGRAALDDAACDAAREWSFAPALCDDSPVAGTLRVPVRFELRD